MFEAIEDNLVSLVETYLEKGADPNALNKYGKC